MKKFIFKSSNFIKKSSNRKLLLVIPLSIISGMPLAIIITSIMTWLTEAEIAISVITSFAIAKIFYSIKFFWAPILDVYSVPFLSFLGKRKSWMIFLSLLLATICFLISLYDPKQDIVILKFLTIALGMTSATYDICWDGTRIEMLDHCDQSTGIFNAGIGYRLGMLISGPFALIMSTYYGWNKVFFIFSLIFLLGLIFIAFVKLKKNVDITQKNHEESFKNDKNLAKLYSVLINTLKQVFGQKYVYIILPAIILYKLGDAMLAVVSTPFFLRIGYSKMHIAQIVKIYGLIATFLGQYCGSLLIKKTNILRALVICGILQAVTNLTYMWLNHQEVESVNLFITICTENFTGGMGAIALVSYLTYFCEKEKYDNTATHYALLSALAVMMNSTVTAKAGTIVEKIGWDKYFIFTVMISIPGIILFLLLNNLSKKNDKFINNSV